MSARIQVFASVRLDDLMEELDDDDLITELRKRGVDTLDDEDEGREGDPEFFERTNRLLRLGREQEALEALRVECADRLGLVAV